MFTGPLVPSAASSSTSSSVAASPVAAAPNTSPPLSLPSLSPSPSPSSSAASHSAPFSLSSPSPATSTAPSPSSFYEETTPASRGPPLTSNQFSFDFSFYAPHGGNMLDGHLPFYAEPYMSGGPSDLCSLAVENGFALQPEVEYPEEMAYSMSTDMEQLGSGRHGYGSPAFEPMAYLGPHPALIPSTPPEDVASSYSSPVAYPPTAFSSPAVQVENPLEPLATAHDGLSSQAVASSSPVTPSTQQQPAARRSSRKRTQVARGGKPAAPTKATKRAKKAKAAPSPAPAPAPAQPVASGSNVQLPPAGTEEVVYKERERATRRTRAEVLALMVPVPPRDCPIEGCGKKFVVSREDDIEHLKEHVGVAKFGPAKVKCPWPGCKAMNAGNTLVDHVNAKHLKLKFRCALHDDPHVPCTWTTPKPGNVNQHLERKHGARKRRLDQGDVPDKKRRRT